MRVARAVWADGFRSAHICGIEYSEPWSVEAARLRFPLPLRKVLREEPDPSYTHLFWRWNGDTLEFCRPLSPVNTGWQGLTASGDSYAPEPARIRLWADLLANPWREEPR
jgi:hypothetical protein